MAGGRKILFCVLDWGTGHASRSVPLINHLTEQGYELTVACGKLLYEQFLQFELRGVAFLELKPFNPLYAKNNQLVLKLLTQMPRFVSLCFSDKRRVRGFVKMYRPDVIISDNRFSCRHKTIPSFYITHQVNILKPRSFKLWRFPTLVHQYMIKKFDACLVPDDGSQLSGKMTEALPKQVNVIRIGLLSRFSSFKSEPEKKHVLVVLSGPEPQRTLFEDAIRQAAKDFHGAIVVVRGSNKSLLNAFPDNVEVHNMAGTKLLKSLFKQCSYVVCRSGYSSLMDLVAIKRDAVIVPTPGQPEQEYLADLVAGRGWFVVQNQKTFRFLNPSEVVNACNIPELSVNTFNTALGNLLHSKGGYKKTNSNN